MSFLKSKKQSKDAKKRMEHMMYIAEQNPEKIYDLSFCELRTVPSRVFSMCEGLQKESLLLYSNLLKELKIGHSINDLMFLRILDLHDNKITALPKEIGKLTNLQVLHVQNNALTALPENIGDLVNLQTLNARDNNLNRLPDSIGKMKSLRILDVGGSNKVFTLAKPLCKVRTLEVLILPQISAMKYPPPHIVEKGLEGIMKFICKDYGIEYIPPSHSLLPVLGIQATTVVDGPSCSTDDGLMGSVIALQRMEDEKREQQLEMERQFAESQREEERLAAETFNLKTKELEEMSKQQQEFEKSVLKQQERQDKHQQKMLRMLENAERNSSALVQRLLKANESSRKQEEFLEEITIQRLKEEEYFKVTQDDLDNLRKKETLAAMQSMLLESDYFTEQVNRQLADQDNITREARQSMQQDDKSMNERVQEEYHSRSELIGQVMFEEDMQRRAFLALQLERDAAHQRLEKQIREIENALAQLTLVEMKRNEYKTEHEQTNYLHSQREELTDLLVTFMKEKDNREGMLKERLVELEDQRETDQIDFWLVQYQRLMDSKPEKLVMQETQMDVGLLKLLSKAEAEDHVPSFARNKVCTIAALIELSDEELRRIGVFQVTVRKNILRLVEEEIAKSKRLDNYELTPNTQATSGPSAPEQIVVEDSGLSAENECTVCMEEQSNVIFLPCGHVCSCKNCSAKLHKCPMCRTDINQKIQIFRN